MLKLLMVFVLNSKHFIWMTTRGGTMCCGDRFYASRDLKKGAVLMTDAVAV